jgi:hypothetical protein
MIAVLLTLGLFVFWLLLGHAVVSVTRRAETLSNLLLAPVAGSALTLSVVNLASRAGVPVGRCAWPVLFALAAGAAVVLWRLRPSFALGRYVPFAGVLVLGLLLVGWPLLSYGFDWVSYCNDDMANYALMAQRFVNHGFGDVPQESELVHGTDFSQFYWFLHVPGRVRPGADLLLAWVASLTGLTTQQAFMPVILAFHLALISAAGALVFRSEERSGHSLLACILMALSAITTLGALYQLIAQVLGLALLVGCVVVVLQPFDGLGRGALIRHGILAGLLLSALLLAYPEVFPFLAAATGFYLVVAWWQRSLALQSFLVMSATGGVTTLVLLNAAILGVLFFLDCQIHHVTADNQQQLIERMPYFLLPSGLANLWGLQPLAGGQAQGAWLWAAIGLGAGLLLAVTVAAVHLLRQREPAALLALVMLGLVAVLLVGRDAFGLFKLAMFCQPAFLPVLVVGWFAVVRRSVLRWAPLLVLGLAGLPTQKCYVRASLGDSAQFVEVRHATRTRLFRQFRQAIAEQPLRRVVLDSCNWSLVKSYLLLLRGTEVCCPTLSLYQAGYCRNVLQPGERRMADVLPQATRRQAERLAEVVVGCVGTERFDLHDPTIAGAADHFLRKGIGGLAKGGPDWDHLITCTPRQSVLNRSHFTGGEDPGFAIQPWEEVSNHLLLVPSLRGQHHMANYATEHDVGLYPLEPDPFVPGRSMAACGRHLLFEVFRPTPGARLVVDFTASFKAGHSRRLPPAAVIGTQRVRLPWLGHGSARVVAPPFGPQVIDGETYLALDMGEEGMRLPVAGVAPQTIFGQEISLDRRYLTGFLRNVSLLSEEQYERLRPPRRVANFPADLSDPALEYAGVYEDGWVTDEAFFQLDAAECSGPLVVRGLVPQVGDDADFTTELLVLLDGREVTRRRLGTGAFEVRCPVPPASGRHRVDLRFSKWQELPGGDGRPAAAHLDAVGFE